MRAHNFSAGPAALPLPVLEQIQAEMVDFRGAGRSVIEMSHRGPEVMAVFEEAVADLRALLGIPDNYKVLFLQGGARGQFWMLAANLLGDRPGGYVDTGKWSAGAVSEARKVGRADVLWSSADDGYRAVPQPGELDVPTGLSYLHYTSNNTIYGTQFHHVPDAGDAPLIVDASSDILSRPMDVSQFGAIYAGAQKNMGPAGVTVLILRDDLLERVPDGLPEVFDYRKVAGKDSMLNTPPVFAVYVVGLVAKHLLQLGGLDAVAATNGRKAERLYRTIDESAGFYVGHAAPHSRSWMNATFRLGDDSLQAEFLAGAAERNLHGLKGHRSVGGLRASIYNAVPEASVDALIEYMKDFRAARL
jgi:phosphoserine aminotransferase